MLCPNCGSSDYSRNGHDKISKEQRYICKCGREFREKTAMHENEQSWSENGNSATGSILTAKRPRDKEEASKLFMVDTDIWEAERMVINSWDGPGKNGQIENYQVKVWFKKRNEKFSLDELANMFKEKISGLKPIVFDKPEYKQSEEVLAEINIADLHFGKLAWWRESGENFDIAIAARRFYMLLSDILNKLEPYNYNKLLFVIGNDFFNADTAKDTTTHGTQVDSDVRWQKRIVLGHELLVNAITELRKHAPVEVKIVLGNHDETTMFEAGEYLKAWFRNDAVVNIDNSPTLRKYYIWNDLMLGFSHGSKEKAVDLFAIMANEMASEWSNTFFREFHVAHVHHERSQDYKGLVVRNIKSPTGTDSWHNGKGFIGSIKGIEGFVYGKNCGLMAHIHSNIKQTVEDNHA